MPHTIRLRGPWEVQQAGEQESRERASSAPRRLTMPCSIAEMFATAGEQFQLSRRFQKPTGLTATSKVTLCLQPLCGENETPVALVVAISLNGTTLVALPDHLSLGIATTSSLRIAIANQLKSTNVLSLTVEITAATASSSQAKFGEVWLEIED